MKKASGTLVLFLSLIFATAAAALGVEVAEKCRQCGMSRSRYDYSRMLVKYRSGDQSAVCSLRCAAADLASAPAKTGAKLQVADYGTRKLIVAEDAVWVLGGSKRGVMTAQPKWAFVSRPAAQDFVKRYGGSIVSFKEAMKAASGEVELEAAAMRQYNQMQRR